MCVSRLLLCLCLAVYCGGVISQKYCCLPNQFEMKCGASGAMSNRRRGMAIISAYMPRMSMDFSGKRFAIHEMAFTEGRGENFTTIMDYNTGTTYVVKWSAKSCSKGPLRGSISGQCIPKEAKWMGTITLGGGKAGGIQCDAYGMSKTSKDPPYKLDVFFNVQSDGCIPISESISGTWGDKTTFETGLSYFDFSNGIKDSSVFDPPSFCDKAALMTDDDVSEIAQAMMWKFAE